MKAKIKFLLISSSMVIVLAGTITTIMCAAYNKNQRTDKQLFIPTKQPILDLEQTIDFSNDLLYDNFKKKYSSLIYNQISTNKLNFYKNTYKIDNSIEDAINKSFEILVSSKKFTDLSKINDFFFIKEKYILLCEKNIPNFIKCLSNNINWDYDFVSLLINNQVSDQLFLDINNAFVNLMSVDYHEKNYLSSISLYNNNEKFKWLLNKTKTTNKEIKQLAKKYAQKQVNDIKTDYSLYQNLLVKKMAPNIEIKFEDYELKDWNFLKSMHFTQKVELNQLLEKILNKKNRILLNQVINNCLNSDEKYKFSYIIFNFFYELSEEEQDYLISLIDDLIKQFNNNLLNSTYKILIRPFLKNKNISAEEKWKTISPTINSLDEKYNFEQNFLKNIFFYIHLFTSIEINNINDINRIISILETNYVSNAIEKGIPIVKEIINLYNEDKNNNLSEIYSKSIELLHVISGRKYHSTKAIIAGIYKLNLKEIMEKTSKILKTVKNSFNLFDKNFTKIETTYNSIKEIIDTIYSTADSLWGFTSLSCITLSNPALFALSDFVANVILGPEIANNPWDNLSNSLLQSVINIVNIVTSPLQGVNELIIFCFENNISFWEWAMAHWECIKENPWTALDPMNWFHSCIKQLVKGI